MSSSQVEVNDRDAAFVGCQPPSKHSAYLDVGALRKHHLAKFSNAGVAAHNIEMSIMQNLAKINAVRSQAKFSTKLQKTVMPSTDFLVRRSKR